LDAALIVHGRVGAISAPVGRDLEIAATSGVIERARRGRAASLLVRGDAGIGKTTLLDAVRRERVGLQVLATQGRAADAEIAYSSLLTLLRPVERQLDVLAGPHADAIRAALMMDRRAVDPTAVQVGVFRVVCALAERTPLLIAVDDADHLDAATAAALTFAIGRLDADPVAAIITMSTRATSGLCDLSTHSLTLGPLDADSIASIVLADGPIDESVLDHCVRFAGGNPLAAIELTRSLTPDERAGRMPSPLVPRAAPGALALGFRTQLDVAGPVVQRAMVVVAADDTGETEIVRRALTHLGEDRDGLDGAEAAGLVVIDGGHVRLSHPLLRAVAYHQVAPRSRRAAHRALAAALTEAHHGAARAWQLAAAADGPDETAAAALDLVARDAARRGGPASAARAWERAAAFTDDPTARANRIAHATSEWFAAGEIGRCRACLDHLADLPVTPDVLAAVGIAGAWVDGPRAGQQRASQLGTRVGSELAPYVRVISIDLAIAGGFTTGVVDDVRDLAEHLHIGPLVADVLSRVGHGTHHASRPMLDGPLARFAGLRRRRAAVEAGRLTEVSSDLALVAPLSGLVLPTGIDDQLTTIALRRHTGDLNQAAAQASLALELLPDCAALPRAALTVASADLDSLLGRQEDARFRLARAVPVLAERAMTELAGFAAWVQGRLDLDAGETSQALESLERAARLRPHLYAAELVIALALEGESSEANRVFGDVDPQSMSAPLPAVRRLRAQGVLDGRPEHFATSAELASAHGLRIEEAETWVVAAQWAVVVGNGDLAAHLRRRASDLLARIGMRLGLARLSGRAPDEIGAILSPAEFRVALAVSGGMTNKEVATTLFISAKTVDCHLQAIYRKLGLRSRTELAVRMGRRGVPTPLAASGGLA
jgi:DNA-binding CsgD family transcriptional regulator